MLERDVRRQARGGRGGQPGLDAIGLRRRGVPRDDQPRVTEAQRAQPCVGERVGLLIADADDDGCRRGCGRQREQADR
jgi:hypothetical protein